MSEHELNKTIKLNNDSEYSSLYSWSLEEYDSEGNKVIDSFIPMQRGSVYLDVKELRYINNFEGTAKSSEVLESEHIVGNLKTQDSPRGGVSVTNTFSMFGTDREIKTFGLEIYKLIDSDEAEEIFSLTPFIGWRENGDIDIPAHDPEDSLHLTILLKSVRFNKIVQHLKDGIKPYYFRLGAVEGFYHRWTPSIHVGDIKILIDEKENYGDEDAPYLQHIEIPEGCDITPPRVGKIRDFNIGFSAGIDSSTDKNSENEDEDYFEEDYEKGLLTDVISSKSSQVSELSKNSLDAIRVPLWIIAITLLLILFNN